MFTRVKALLRRHFPNRALAEQLNDQGTDFAVAGKFQEARKAFKQALRADPKLPEAWANLGLCTLTAGDPQSACDFFKKAIALDPNQAETFDNWGNALVRLGLLTDAAEKHTQALSLQPQLSSAKAHLGNTLLVMGRVEEAQFLVQQAWGESPSDPVIASLALSAALYSTSLSPEQILAGHQRWPGASTNRSVRSPSNLDPERRLKIGYLSGDFRTHSCACFLLPLMRAHDRKQIEVFAYNTTINEDQITGRFRQAADHWQDGAQFSDISLAQQIKSDEIDVLVDCSGHTEGNRLAVFGFRPAPIQVTWLGYPSTTGLNSIDLRLSDSIADPMGESDHLHSEQVVRLPNGYHTYAPLVETPEPSGEIKTGPIRFGLFHNLAKFSDTSIELWAEVLKQVPNSLLCLKAKGLDDTDVQKYTEQRFISKGITKDRLTLSPWQSAYGKHFEDFAAIDVMLDATPYNGTTTTCEALWMGVPVVTLSGDRTANRVGASLLTQIDHPEWIARSADEYVSIATELASAHQLRKMLRSSLRQDLLASTLGDEALFARTVEGAYRKAWQQMCERQASL